MIDYDERTKNKGGQTWIKFGLAANAIALICGACLVCAVVAANFSEGMKPSPLLAWAAPVTPTPTLVPTATPDPFAPPPTSIFDAIGANGSPDTTEETDDGFFALGATPEGQDENAAPPQTISGQGRQLTRQFTLNEGLAILKMTHTGSENFVVSMLDQDGGVVALLANQIGAFEGSKALAVGANSYTLDISADGIWTVSIEQPEPAADLPLPPHIVSGRGQQASPFIRLAAGSAAFNISHTGNRNYVVSLLASSGQPIGLLINNIGSFETSQMMDIPAAGVYLLDISGDGDWSIEVEQP